MKIGFSSLVSPGWDLETIIMNASAQGFDGVELRGLQGELHLPLVPELVRDPDQVRERFSDKNVELVCLGASASLTSRSPREVARQKTIIVEFVELADRLGCPYVRIFAGEVERGDYAPVALSRIADALQSLVPVATRHNVTLLVENGGDFPSSQDLWQLIDAVSHPAVRACWNQCHAMTLGERPTTSLPRLGSKTGLLHMCDAAFEEHGVLLNYGPLGQGDVEVARQIELLRGLLYDGYLIFEWPKLWVDSLPPPDNVLPDAAKFLRECVDARQNILSAYKGDKNAPRMVSRNAVSSEA
ncbi:MAG: sugar phosphate isomerase/epimerase family protein [Planctomycetota bacterium]|jgi:sugar phosphate isomerase/epimerase